MTESQTFPSLTRKTIEEHQQIHFFLDQLARSLEKLEPGRVEGEALRRLAAQIGGLRERLHEHFEHEEEGGLFRALVESLPEARGETRALTEEHQSALDALDRSRIRAERGQVEDAALLRKDLEGFIEKLRRHEQREEALLTQALERETRSS